ncbi:MAG: hypothetical protein AB9M60_12215 [Leptothrix sp. (in: b-proteobacteria)]
MTDPTVAPAHWPSAPGLPALPDAETAAAADLVRRVRQAIPFQAHILGLGQRDARGGFEPLRCSCTGMPQRFLHDYAQVAREDVAAHLFCSNPTSVLAIDVAQTYPRLPSRASGARMGRYLRSHHVSQILLAGVESSHGIAWMTLYRLATEPDQPPPPFSADEAEAASYIVRAGLYEWQARIGLPRRQPVAPERFEVIRLTPKVLDVALRLARGYAEKEIAKELGRQAGTVRNQVVEVYKVFDSSKAIAERLNGPLPGPKAAPARLDPDRSADPPPATLPAVTDAT